MVTEKKTKVQDKEYFLTTAEIESKKVNKKGWIRVNFTIATRKPKKGNVKTCMVTKRK